MTKQTKLLVIFVVCFSVILSLLAFYIIRKRNLDSRSNANTVTKQISVSLSHPVLQTESESLYINILLNPSAGDKVSAATIKFTMSSALVLDVQKTKTNNSHCTPKLDTVLDVSQSDANVVTITRSAIKPSAELPTGTFCLSTVWFTKASTVSLAEASASLGPNIAGWEIVGPGITYVPVLGNSTLAKSPESTVPSVTVTTTNVTTTPTAVSSPTVTVTGAQTTSTITPTTSPTIVGAQNTPTPTNSVNTSATPTPTSFYADVSATPTDAVLPVTGIQEIPPMVLGLFLLTVGIALVVLIRRKNSFFP